MNGNAKWAVWLFRLTITVALGAVVADRVRVADRMSAHEATDAEVREDIRALETALRIYHGGN